MVAGGSDVPEGGREAGDLALRAAGDMDELSAVRGAEDPLGVAGPQGVEQAWAPSQAAPCGGPGSRGLTFRLSPESCSSAWALLSQTAFSKAAEIPNVSKTHAAGC